MPNEVKQYEKKEARRQRAIARNSQYRGKYEAEGNKKGLRGPALIAFIAHKIGIPKGKQAQKEPEITVPEASLQNPCMREFMRGIS